MRFFSSLPKDEAFYSRYAALLPTLRRLGYLAQIISALTEIGVIYALLYGSLADFLPNLATPAAVFGAVLGTAFIEVGLRQFLPYSARAILHRRFAGLDRLMTAFILAAAVGLMLTSGLLSFYGSKDIVEQVAPPPVLRSTAAADSLAAASSAAARLDFQRDSGEIARRYAALIQAQKTAFSAKIQNARRLAASTNEGSRRTGRAKVAGLEADRAAVLADLEGRKAGEMAGAVGRKSGTVERIEGERAAVGLEVATANTAAVQKSETKVKKYGGGLAWFTVVCLIVLVLAVSLEEMFSKGSGIEQVAQPNQYNFSAGVFSEFWNTFLEKWNYHARTWIKRWADKTPPPPKPTEPPTLYELADGKPRRVTLRTAPDALPYVANGMHNGTNGTTSHNLRDASARAVHIPAKEVVEPDVFASVTRARDNATVTPDPFAKDCEQCGQPFAAKVAWQRFCCEGCKLTHHEAKHGRKFDPTYKRKPKPVSV